MFHVERPLVRCNNELLRRSWRSRLTLSPWFFAGHGSKGHAPEAGRPYCRRPHPAAEWEERSGQASNEAERVSSLRLAKGWSHLAKSYEFVVELERFILDAHQRGWPIQVENLPKFPLDDE